MAAVDIWTGRLDLAAAEVERLRLLLSMPERARAERFRFARDRRRFIVRRARRRELLGMASGVAPQRLTFRTDDDGKPRLVERDLAFSASHSGDHWVLALSDASIGVDIEAHKPGIDHRDIARGLFAPGEVAALSAMPDPAASRCFFDIWARKEAFVKALGQGLSYPLTAFEVSAGSKAELVSGGDGWVMAALTIAPQLAGAVVARDDGKALSITRHDFDALRAAA
ncbi:MAG: 4'-phosphopantetheinyl transferase family protein [Sphingomonas sp.]